MSVLQQALQIYQTYCENQHAVKPLGFVYNHETQSLKLLFNSPVLLPAEEFIPLEHVLEEQKTKNLRQFT